MNANFEKIAQEALSLPNDTRILLVDRLVESLDPLSEDEFHSIWTNEALRRRNQVRNGLVKTIPGDDALLQVREAVAKK
jgi:hypothetical protein